MIHSLKIFLLLSFVVFTNAIIAQSKSTINFTFAYGSVVLNFDDSLNLQNDSSFLRITALKFYISNIQFFKNGEVVLEEKNSFHLIDANQIIPNQILVENKQNIAFDEIKFDLGIDSITNVSGAMGGDLDPTKGMYWTWQNGYINFKLEGISKLCKTRNNEFTFHLGGYQQPYYCFQTLRFKTNNSSFINFKLDVLKILNQVDLEKTNHVMSPSEEAVMLSKIVANAFNLLQN